MFIFLRVMGELNAGQDDVPESEMASLTPKQMLSRFYALQEERVETYHMFEEYVTEQLICLLYISRVNFQL